jgi:hypothetical protein
MRSRLLPVWFLAVCFGISGCSEEDSTPPANSPSNTPIVKPTPPPPPPLPTPVSSTESQPPSSSVSSPKMTVSAGKSPETNNQPELNSNPSSIPSEDQIELSAGVSLPQLLPEGMAMGFSVDYAVQSNLGTATYVWVIERPQGKPEKIPIHFNGPKGNLVYFIPGWRVTDGPFHTHMEDKNGNRLSATVELLGQGL